jgi:hypothetical protein
VEVSRWVTIGLEGDPGRGESWAGKETGLRG